MKPVQAQVKSLFTQALRNAFPSIQQETMLMKGNPKFGDYQCTNAMGLCKDHGKTLGVTKPGELAELIKAGLPKNDLLEEVTASANGFVTVKISQKWIQSQVTAMLGSELQYDDSPQKRVVVDFSSPNIAKEMHVGHLRSTIIGESTCRVLEFCGHEVHRLNHVGDWGTQFGMLIEYMREKYPNFEKQLPDVSDLQEFYKASKKRFDEDEAFKLKAQKAVVALQGGDKPARAAWQKICDVSRIAFEKVYKRLDIVVEERGESFYNSLIKPLVTDLQARGLVVDSDGAQCFFTPRLFPNGQGEIPLMAVKSDGGFGYDSTDLAAIYHRLFVMRSDWVVYVTDMGQELHFHMIFDAAEQAGWHRPGITRCDHMGFGVVQGEDKKKFKTRSGDVVKLGDLIDESVERTTVEIKKRVADAAERKKERKEDSEEGKYDLSGMDEKEIAEAANRLGIAAIRYFDMKQNRVSPYVFNYDRMLDAKGNTAVYLFYAYARIRGIQNGAGIDISSIKATELSIGHPAERELSLKVLQFPDVIEAILKELHLHLMTDYLWELSNMLAAFYRDCHVIRKDPTPEQKAEMRSRLLLCEATRKVMHKSFHLLGFTPLERI